MDYEFRVVVEKVSVASQKVVKRDTIKIYDIIQPQSILDLGLRHEEQISLLSLLHSYYSNNQLEVDWHPNSVVALAVAQD
jgi:hypothetical protein